MIFNINAGKIEICDKLSSDLKHKVIVLKSNRETVNCDSGLCERINNIDIEIMDKYNDNSMLYFLNNNITVAIDSNIYYLLYSADIAIKKGKNIFIEQINHYKINN